MCSTCCLKQFVMKVFWQEQSQHQKKEAIFHYQGGMTGPGDEKVIYINERTYLGLRGKINK